MRRTLAALAVLALGIAGATPGAAPSRPVLRVAELSPVVVTGRGFPAGGIVRVTTWVRGRRTLETVRADGSGRFRVVVERLRLTGALRCAAGVAISARTESGRLVLWQPRGLPNCPSPLRPPTV